jgi:transposase
MGWVRMHPTWALGFEDEVWWSRVTQPHLHSWSEAGQPLRLVEQSVAKTDPDPKALACYGLLLPGPDATDRRQETVWLRFVDGRPVSAITTQFLDWCCQELARAGKTALVLVWDNASWHRSKEARGWITAHNRQVKQRQRGVRIIACFLPSKSPWLNAIEAKWAHGKRRVAEPARLLTASELEERVCSAFGCPQQDHLAIPEKAA